MVKKYKTSGTCSQMIEIETEEEIVRRVKFIGGCNGNTAGISRLVEGRPMDEVISLLRGIRCGFKPTSCPDQLARALEEMKEEAKA